MADPKSYIGGTLQAIVGTPATVDASGFNTLFGGAPVTIGKVVSISQIGDKHADISSTTISPGRTFHQNGAADGGTITVTVLYDSAGDAGLQLIAAQNGGNTTVSFKIVDPDSKVSYLYGIVGNLQDAQRDAQSMKSFTFTIAVNSATIRVSL